MMWIKGSYLALGLSHTGHKLMLMLCYEMATIFPSLILMKSTAAMTTATFRADILWCYVYVDCCVCEFGAIIFPGNDFFGVSRFNGSQTMPTI